MTQCRSQLGPKLASPSCYQQTKARHQSPVGKIIAQRFNLSKERNIRILETAWIFSFAILWQAWLYFLFSHFISGASIASFCGHDGREAPAFHTCSSGHFLIKSTLQVNSAETGKMNTSSSDVNSPVIQAVLFFLSQKTAERGSQFVKKE